MDSQIVNDSRFQRAIAERLKAGDTFKDMLNKVCGVIMLVLGDCPSEHYKVNATPFELVCFDMIEQFQGEPAHFKYVFMDTWTIVDCFFVDVK